MTTQARKPREVWTQKRVADLVTTFHDQADEVRPARALSAVETRKLIELGLVAKPTPVVLTDGEERICDNMARAIAEFPEEKVVLGARRAIAALRELLPKRAPKGETK